MASQFSLPQAAPKGNTYPPQDRSQTPQSRTASPGLMAAAQATVELSALKDNDRPVVISVIETTTPSPPLEQFEAPRRSSEDARSSTPQKRNRAQSRANAPQLTIQTGAAPKEPPPTHSGRSSATLVRQNSGDSTEHAPQQQQHQQEVTPVMRSRFPQLNPSLPITHQNHHSIGDMGPLPPPPSVMRPSHQYSPSMYSTNGTPPMAALQNPWITSQVTALAASSPLRIAEEPPPDLSAAEDLLDLWSVANGHLSHEAKDSYDLGLQCDSLDLDQEQMHFTSATAPMYSLDSSGSTVAVTRTHPLEASTIVTISTPKLSIPTVASPLLATIFPSLAERATLASVKDVARQHEMNPRDTAALEAEALKRIRSSEAVSLLWDSDSSAYFLAHPSLSGATEATVPGVLPILISPGASVTLVNMSNQPLLALDLMEATLTVHTSNITSLSPSLYTLDTLLSSLLTLLLHLHRHTTSLRPPSATATSLVHQPPVPHFDPPPTSRGLRNSASVRSTSSVHHAFTTNRQHVKTHSRNLQNWLTSSTSVRSSAAVPVPPMSIYGGGRMQNSSTLALHSHSRPQSTFSAVGSTFGNTAPRSPALSTFSHSHFGSVRGHGHNNQHNHQAHQSYTSPYLGSISPKDLESALDPFTQQNPPSMSTPIPSLPTEGIAPELRKDTTGVDLSRFQAYDLSDKEKLGKGTRGALRLLYWAFGVLVWILGVAIGVVAAAVVALAGLGSKNKAKDVEEGAIREG